MHKVSEGFDCSLSVRKSMAQRIGDTVPNSMKSHNNSFTMLRPGFKFMAALSLLCGGAIAGLYVWGLVKIWDYPTHEVPIAQCRDISTLVALLIDLII